MTDLDIIVLFAIRYALQRNTAAPLIVLNYLAQHADELSGPARRQMGDEIAGEMLLLDDCPARYDWDSILRLLRGKVRGKDGEVAV